MRSILLAAMMLSLLCVGDVQAAGSGSESEVIVEVSDEAPPGTAMLELSAGQTIEFRITTNPTTGFDWQIAGLDEQLLGLLTDDYETRGNGVGAGGVRTLVYRAQKAGSCEITMTHCRPWDCANTTLRVFSARVNVR